MTKKNLLLVLLFVVLAGAIAGAFVFLNQIDVTGPTAIPGVTGSGQTGVHQGVSGSAFAILPIQSASAEPQSPYLC